MTCAARPEARLETTAAARTTLLLAVVGIALPVISLITWRRSSRPGPVSDADAPLLQGARWLAITTLVGWIVAFSAWLLQKPA